ncbi:MAG: beta-lactamase family protein, partial [bacterium]|nr:beta-lactamase family protein [bacterium]
MGGANVAVYVVYNEDLELHAVMSVTKSIVSLLVGVSIENNFVRGTGARILSLFPEYPNLQNHDSRKNDMTVGHFLTMQHGLLWDETSYAYDDPRNSYVQMSASGDWVKFTLDLPMAANPGEVFSGGLATRGGI